MPAWTPQADAELLRAIVQVKRIQVSATDWNAISTAITTKMGGDYSGNACRLHFAKIIKEGDDFTASPTKKRKNSGDDEDQAPAPKSPAKKQKKSTNAKSSAKPQVKPEVKKETCIKDEEEELLDDLESPDDY
ncbi:hypothetical protein BGW36DRAFT_426042 [Talaromyces proteolyticus]|uniref:Myb-like domain-containing protein n=1 Tax=Talaromyces proteolyticus TaxID=1131652 RepID=A0AAD4KQM6_9EURO|nr:uncharacterized protein BGW36DRAFT_426042 [Talaromyces proteolyticus]KAH8698330.1 hypothetical protein BGW36DRAFT_426042 [Talaromyces proteolyticus]